MASPTRATIPRKIATKKRPTKKKPTPLAEATVDPAAKKAYAALLDQQLDA